MPTPEELLQKKPIEIYGLAVRAGIEVAVKRQSFSRDGSRPLDDWRRDNPEFTDPRVAPLLDLGAHQSFQELVQLAIQTPNVVGIFNSGGMGDSKGTFFPTVRLR